MAGGFCFMEEKKKNVTKYGEFIPSYYAWIGLDEQKEIVELLENITKTQK